MGENSMAKSNRDRVGEIMDLLKNGLGSYVSRRYKATYGDDYLKEMERKLLSESFSIYLPDEATALEEIDTQGWLNLMIRSWNEAFASHLGAEDRRYTYEMREARNKLAHQKPFTNEQTQRIADTAKLLLEAVNATDESKAAGGQSNELLRIRFERDARNVTRQAPRAIDSPRTTDATLKPWRQVIEPHPDVRSGRFTQAEFAADLAAVMSGEAAPEYGEAGPFFSRTYMTEGLRDLVANGIKRLTGGGGDPVVQLQTNFGGGKTHSMLALYHAFSDDFKLSNLPDYDEIRKLVSDIDDDLKAHRAVIVGTSFNVSQPRQHADCTTRTIWGEIAYQLGGAAGYDLVEQNDLQGTNPGSDTLVKLLEDHGPALIILDELVRLAQNVYKVEPAPAAGSFEAILAFMQSLTEAVKRSSDSLLLVSIPASDIEIGGGGGHTTLEQLRQTLGRLESVWKPVSAEESYEIVRRRLFTEVTDFPARDAVVNAFSRMYGDSRTDYPRDAAEGDYRRKMQQAYPIHPELFARLYEDWSTLERFQRTRGVLRMMASVIHRLWIDGDQSLLIMPGSIPLWNKTVQTEMVRYLPQNFAPVVDVDIDGTGSKPYQIDQEVKQLGKFTASRRVARAIFLGSAPTVAAQRVRGVEEVRINLATVQPGERASVFSDALRRMSNQLTYLYNDGTRYWYDTRATVTRTAEDRAQSMDDYKVMDEAGKRLRAQPWDKRALGSVHFLPESSAEIPDEQSARVVVLSPEYTHRNNRNDSEAMQYINEIMHSRGNSPRHHRNMLVFIAPDEARNAEWADSKRKYLAWESIKADRETLNLDVQQSKQVEEALKRESETVDKRLQETYSWLIVPLQPVKCKPVTLSQERMSGDHPFLERAARKLKSNEWLIQKMSPDSLLMELEPLGWRDMQRLSIKKLWEWLTNYCYLPRFFDQKVLEASIMDGVSRLMPAFAYATGVDEDGKYTGLTMGKSFTLYFDDKALIVQPEIAQKQLAEINPPPAPAPPGPDNRGDDDLVIPPPAALPKPKKRYYGSVQVDPQRAMRDLIQIADEIIVRLASLPGADVKITVEIEGLHGEGFDDATLRAISENSRTLNFKDYGFDD